MLLFEALHSDRGAHATYTRHLSRLIDSSMFYHLVNSDAAVLARSEVIVGFSEMISHFEFDALAKDPIAISRLEALLEASDPDELMILCRQFCE
jgi:hypothetical protein